MAYIGASVKRKEDRRLLTGRGRYVADVRLVGMLHAAILRSPHAHARILGIDPRAALALPGVHAVLTAVELPADLPPIPMRLSPLKELERALQFPLASDRVRYVGEPVAVVVGENRYLAEDACELIEVDYEPLAVVTEARRAIEPGAARLHETVPDNVAGRFVVEVGEVEAAFAEADLVMQEEFCIQRHAGVPMENRGVVANFDRGRGVLTVWGPTKVSHFNRTVLARLLGLAEHNVHFLEPDVGGGFGVRGEIYPEDVLIPLLALRLDCPIAWIEDRAEHLKAANHSREQWHQVSVAVRRDGTILALRDRLLNNMGAYVRTHGATVPTMTSALLPGPYRIPNYRCEVSCVLTNKAPTGTYRGPGRFEAVFVRERLIDLVADRLRLDPAEVRQRNFVRPEEMPYDLGTNTLGVHVVYDSGNYPSQLERVLEATDYHGLRRMQAEARAQGRAVGIGLGCFVEKTGLGPWEYARVEVGPSGEAVVYSGLESLGQGMETVLAQICADGLGVPFESVTVVHGDTALVPYGIGAFASRGTVVAGTATYLAARKVCDKALRLAAHLLEAAPDDLELRDGWVHVRGAPDRHLSLADVARAAAPTSALKLGERPGLSEEAFFEVDHMAYPYGVHLAVVEVDRESGQIEILRYLIAYDVGKAVNPVLVEGQVVGGSAQGIGGALLEELVYTDDGQMLSASFMDYLLPTAMEMPRVEVLITEDAPSPLNPLGVKGAGEGGTVGAPGALANAVADALGVPVRELPLTPERVRELAKQTPCGWRPDA